MSIFVPTIRIFNIDISVILRIWSLLIFKDYMSSFVHRDSIVNVGARNISK